MLDGLTDLFVDAGNGLSYFETEGCCAGWLQQLHRRDDAEIVVNGDGALVDDAFGAYKQRCERVVRHSRDGVDNLGNYPLELLHHSLPVTSVVRRVLDVENELDAPPLLCFLCQLALEVLLSKSLC